jgi:hypothetical protein
MFKRTAGVSCSLKESIDGLEIIVCGKMFHCKGVYSDFLCFVNKVEKKRKDLIVMVLEESIWYAVQIQH